MPTTSNPFGAPAMEPLPGRQKQGYFVKSFRKACVDFHWHFHPELELTYIKAGQGVFHAGRSLTPYFSGDLYLLGSNLPHAYGSHPQERNGANWTVMHFSPERMGREFWLLPQNARLRRLLAQSPRGIRFRGEGARQSSLLLARLEKSSPKDVGLALWIELLERLARDKERIYLNAKSSPETAQDKVDPRLQKVLAWIDDNVESSSLIQADAARLIGLSPQSFCRFFRQIVGRPFHCYVNELRIAHACSGLINSEKTVSEIAFHSGFSNLANFNRRFLELLGQTPTKYRQSGGGF
ncbi:AraC family transcriptional regulator [soil metagenome]